MAEARLEGDRLTVPFTKDRVKDAPSVHVEGGHLDVEQERRLYDYYGMSYSETTSDSELPDSGPDTDTAGTARTQREREFSDSTTDEAMTRSEEHLTAGTRTEEAGRARLRKYVVTDEETMTVPVRKERATLEREPITDANLDNALAGPEISEDEHEVVLHEERPVVEKKTEPVERVRLDTEATTDEETVSDEVRKEQIEVEGDVDRRS